MESPALPSPLTTLSNEEAAPGLITQPYLLALFSVPFYIDPSGRRWLDALWAKDLVEHVRYIRNLTLVAPLSRDSVPASAVALDQLVPLSNIVCVDLPKPRDTLDALLQLPKTLRVLWRLLGRTSFVHTAVAGWPLPEAWLLGPLLLLRRRPLYINVESAFWRLVPGERPSMRRFVRAIIAERLNRACIERSDISTFTHEGYRRSLLRRNAERGHVIEASWIDEADVLCDEQLRCVIERRRGHTGKLKLVFAARLTREKGLIVLLDAVAAALRDHVPIMLDVYGEGPLMSECAERIRAIGPDAGIRLCGTMPYDRRFFETMREYDLLVVPTISDEQPRIVFDAYAQGLPVIGSRTEGLVQSVEDNITGFLVPVGDVGALQLRLADLAACPSALADMAHACVNRARRSTHQQMHRKRWRLLVDRFPALTLPA